MKCFTDLKLTDMHLEDSDVVDIPSDDSVPPQPKKKRMSKHGDGVTAPKPRGKLSTGKGKGKRS
jgi:hypothetical protein